MKAWEMALLTARAIDMINKERPKQIFNDLISKMKDRAESGYGYIDFCFGENQDVAATICAMLESEGYRIKILEKSIYNISWTR